MLASRFKAYFIYKQGLLYSFLYISIVFLDKRDLVSEETITKGEKESKFKRQCFAMAYTK